MLSDANVQAALDHMGASATLVSQLTDVAREDSFDLATLVVAAIETYLDPDRLLLGWTLETAGIAPAGWHAERHQPGERD